MPNAEVVGIGHHISHAYNIIASNNFKGEASLLILDSYGDNLSGLCGRYNDLRLNIVNEFSADNSLGLLYSAATQHLGLGGFGSEGKMQGLASYGNYDHSFSIKSEIQVSSCTINLSQDLISKDDFSDQELYAVNALKKNEYYNRLMRRRFYDEAITDAHADFAKTIQDDIFSAIRQLANSLKIENCENLIIGGGIAQNSSLINYLYLNTSYRRVLTSTSCSDRGNSLGALAAFLQSIGKFLAVSDPFLGPDPHAEHDESADDIDVERIANLIYQNKVIGLVEGRSELGARALGNRSILACPKSATMKDRLNQNVKHREGFRPFAPIIKESMIHQYFDVDGSEDHRYMTKCFNAKDHTSEDYPSAVHVDNTSRLQILNKQDSRRLIYRLYCTFGTSRGRPSYKYFF